MNLLEIKDNEFYLPYYEDRRSEVLMRVTGCVVAEISKLTSDDLTEVQVLTEEKVLVATYSNMALASSIVYNSEFDATEFTLVKEGTDDVSAKLEELQSQISDLQSQLVTMANEKS